MAGHQGSFTDACYVDERGQSRLGCAKSLASASSRREYAVYNYVAKLRPKTAPPHLIALRTYMSATHGKCTKEGGEFFIMENALGGMTNTHSLDFKLGTHTVMMEQCKLRKKMLHRSLDFISTSCIAHLRLEGSSDRAQLIARAEQSSNATFREMPQSMVKWLHPKQKLFVMHPFFVFDSFFEGASRSSVGALLAQLEKLNRTFTVPNLKAAKQGLPSIAFVGSSILLVRGTVYHRRNRGARRASLLPTPVFTFKLIDFAHPIVREADRWAPVGPCSSTDLFAKYADNYARGLLSLEHLVRQWLIFSSTSSPSDAPLPSPHSPQPHYPRLKALYPRKSQSLLQHAHVKPSTRALFLTVVKARGLAIADLNGRADPYCVVHWCTRMIGRTVTQFRTLTPTWQETFFLPECRESTTHALCIECFDYDLGKRDDFMGEVHLSIQEVRNLLQQSTTWVPLTSPVGKKRTSLVQGELCLALCERHV